jgi:hypothetical protein
MLNNRPKLHTAILIVAVVIIVLAVASVVLTSLGTARMKISNTGFFPAQMMGEIAYDSVGGSSIASPSASPVSRELAKSQSSRDVIQTADLALIVEKAEESVMQIAQLTVANGGYVENSQVRESSFGSKYGSMTLRVPSVKLSDTIAQIKGLATKVSSESLNSEDVTAQLVDLEARLKNLAAEEESYRSILTRSGKIDDVLAVTRELSRVRGEIEQLTASKKYMTDKVAMSAINVSLTAVSEAQVAGIVWRPIATAKTAIHNLLSGLAGVADWLIAFVIYLPLLIVRLAIIVLILWVIWKIVLWLKRKFFPKPTLTV